MPLPAQNLLAWKGVFPFLIARSFDRQYYAIVCISMLHFSAMSSSILRLVHRLRRRKLGWDDLLAIIAFALEIIDFVLMWLRFQPKCESQEVSTYLLFWKPPCTPSCRSNAYPPSKRIFLLLVCGRRAVYHPLVRSFYIWFAFSRPTTPRLSRASLALSLARIFGPKTTPRRYTLGLAALFVLADVGCIIILSTVCKSGRSPWKFVSSQRCGMPPPSGIFSVIGIAI